MKNNGFVTSALLYGILSVFIVLLLSTVAIAGNRKLASDRVKQNALDDVQNLTTDESCFELEPNEDGKYTIKGYNINADKGCTKTVFIPKNNRINKIGENAFKVEDANNSFKNITIPGTIIEISDQAFIGNKNTLFIIKNKNSSLEIPDGSEGKEDDLWGATKAAYRLE